MQLDTPRLQAALELLQVWLLAHGHLPDTVLPAPRREGTGGLTGTPLDRVQPVAALVMCVVPMLLPAASRFTSRCGTSAPSGISKG